jgi:hypothetical protein
MFITQIVDFDWTGLGGKRAVYRYKMILSESPLLSSNIVTIAEWLRDGDTALDVFLNQKRRGILEIGTREVDCICAFGGEGLASSRILPGQDT